MILACYFIHVWIGVSAAYSDHNQLNFGHQVVDNLHICVIEEDLSQDGDGFYTTVASIQI